MRLEWRGGNAGHERRTRLLERAIALGIPLEGTVRLPTGVWLGSGQFPLFPWLLTSIYMSHGSPEVRRGLVQRAIQDGFTCSAQQGFAIAKDTLLYRGDLDAFRMVLGYDGFWQATPRKELPDVPTTAGWMTYWVLERQAPQAIPDILEAVATRFSTLEAPRGGDVLKRLVEAAKQLPADMPVDEAEALGRRLGDWARQGLMLPSMHFPSSRDDFWAWNTSFLLQPPSLPVRLYLSGLTEVLWERCQAMEQHTSTIFDGERRVHVTAEYIQEHPWLAHLPVGHYAFSTLLAHHPFWQCCLPQHVLADRLRDTLRTTSSAPATRTRL